MRGGPVGQCGGLLVCACRSQGVQQDSHAARVVEGGVRGGPVGQCGGLLVCACLPQVVQEGEPRGSGRQGRRGRQPNAWGGGPRAARPGDGLGRRRREGHRIWRRFCTAGQRPGTGRGRERRHRAWPGHRARRAWRLRTRIPPGGSDWRGAPGHAGPGSPRAGTAALPRCRAGQRARGRHRGPGVGGCGSAARGHPCTGRRRRPAPAPASLRPARPTQRRSGTPARRHPERPAAGPRPCPGGGRPSPR